MMSVNARDFLLTMINKVKGNNSSKMSLFLYLPWLIFACALVGHMMPQRGFRILKKEYEFNGTKSIVKDYDVDNVSEKAANIILSYTDYINRVVWKKY